MHDSTAERAAAARTEAVFRDINERIAEGAGQLDVPEARFLCECGDVSCATGVTTTLQEYERVREDGATFLVAPGHDMRAIEAVVERREEHEVVAKHDRVAAEVARSLDPRASGAAA